MKLLAHNHAHHHFGARFVFRVCRTRDDDKFSDPTFCTRATNYLVHTRITSYRVSPDLLRYDNRDFEIATFKQRPAAFRSHRAREILFRRREISFSRLIFNLLGGRRDYAVLFGGNRADVETAREETHRPRVLSAPDRDLR